MPKLHDGSFTVSVACVPIESSTSRTFPQIDSIGTGDSVILMRLRTG